MGFEPSPEPELFSADGKRTEMKWQGVPDSRCSNAKMRRTKTDSTANFGEWSTCRRRESMMGRYLEHSQRQKLRSCKQFPVVSVANEARPVELA